MTSALFAHTSRPTANQQQTIEDQLPTVITGFTFPQADHKLEVNAKAVAAMGTNKAVTIPNGPFNGLIAGLKP